VAAGCRSSNQPSGSVSHDLTREVLTADLRWRNPDWYAELHRRARIYYTTRLQQTHAQEQHRVLFDYIFLHRNPRSDPVSHGKRTVAC